MEANKKIIFGEKSKVNIKWKVNPIDYLESEERDIIAKFSAKYGIKKENIRVEPVFKHMNADGMEDDFSNSITLNIQDKEYQRKLIKMLYAERGITDYDFDSITEIDDKINSMIDTALFSNNNKYQIKWVKWSNFMSYGEGNRFDFTNLDGLVLLTSEPANQGGKSTFCIDLIRFLLFGKVTSREDDWVLSEAFNHHLPEATEVSVEGCICINGADYMIRRTLTRPALKKRTAASKVKHTVTYYRYINDDNMVEMDEEELLDGQTTKETTKTIKDYIGNESDFDLMICVNSDNLKGLISLKDTERGRLISRWIGLLPIEQKDKVAREYFNKTISPSLISHRYAKADVLEVIEGNKVKVEGLEKELASIDAQTKEHQGKLDELTKNYEGLLSSKAQIDDSLTKIDIKTVETKIASLIQKGKDLRALKEFNEKKLSEIKVLSFDEENYKKAINEYTEQNTKIALLRQKIEQTKKDIDALTKSEFCPTCGAKLKDVDNKEAIETKKKEYEEILLEGTTLKNVLTESKNLIAKLDKEREEYNEGVKLKLVVDKNNVDIENTILAYRESSALLKSIEANKEAIANNNKIDTTINLLKVNIGREKNLLEILSRKKVETETSVRTTNREIEEYKKIVDKLTEEEKLIRSWKLYLEAVGKNGICKIVLRSTLPLINGELKRLLNGVCDFDVTVSIDDRNDVAFSLVRDGVVSKLASGSGFEQTVASLALRSVLSKISTFSKPSFVVFDEVLGGVSDENYEQVKLLYDKIVKDYGFIFQITHLKQIADWHNHTIVVKKVNNISKIQTV